MRPEDAPGEGRGGAEGLRRWCLGRATAIVEALLRQEGAVARDPLWARNTCAALARAFEEHVRGPGEGPGGKRGPAARWLTATELLEARGLPCRRADARAFNRRMEELGLLERKDGRAALTEKGRAYGKNERDRKVPLYREDRAGLLLELLGTAAGNAKE